VSLRVVRVRRAWRDAIPAISHHVGSRSALSIAGRATRSRWRGFPQYARVTVQGLQSRVACAAKLPALRRIQTARRPALEDAEHLRPNRDSGEKETQRGERNRFFKNRPDHDLTSWTYFLIVRT
jgi:hypothetical protein